MRRLLQIDFVRFCIVGTLGFGINFLLLTLLYRVFNSPLFIAQIIAAEIALFSNFMFHNKWTYKGNDVRKTLTKLIIQFHLTSWAAVIGSALMVTFWVKVADLNYVLALAISSATALLWNFGWSKFVIWRDRKDPEAKKSEEVNES